ncbi:hypothetical protein L873DRAFT_1813259 [Choiromyces venosus 120613-1]|uniref:Uncharacterized protein n=1 Tax=Choiromyces venosus 120613-1 TaxID=1336337 RepID=A0A3N4JA01_9PEZI|nr:hypothetical protein L873DRAFT_1813259 [Choiromyces venosus 120613-1]
MNTQSHNLVIVAEKRSQMATRARDLWATGITPIGTFAMIMILNPTHSKPLIIRIRRCRQSIPTG